MAGLIELVIILFIVMQLPGIIASLSFSAGNMFRSHYVRGNKVYSFKN